MSRTSEHEPSVPLGARRSDTWLDRNWRAVAGGEALLMAAIGLWGLGSKSFWYDEAFSASQASGSWDAFFDTMRRTDPNMSLYNAFLKVWRVGGDSEVWLRLPSVIAAMGAVFLLVLVGRRLVGTRAALLAGLFLALAPFLAHYAQEARSYSMVLLVVIAMTGCFVVAVEDDEARAWIAFVVLAVVAVHLQFFGGLVVVANVGALVGRKGPVPWRRLAIALLAVFVACLPLAYVVMRGPTAQLSWIQAGFRRSTTEMRGLLGGRTLFLVAVVAMACALVMLVRWWATGREPVARWRLGVAVSWALVPVLTAGIYTVAVRPLFVARYLIVVLPAFALVVAWSIGQIRMKWVAVAAVVVIVGFSIRGISDWYSDPPFQDWRSVARSLATDARPGDGVVFCVSKYRPGLELYVLRSSILANRLDPLSPDEPWSTGVHDRPATLAAPLPGRVWLVNADERERGRCADVRRAASSAQERNGGVLVLVRTTR